jgi:hypothetical protein
MAQLMAHDLAGSRLRVVLVPDKFHPGGVRRLRAVDEQNPAWYRAFCEHYPARRRRPRRRGLPDTAIKRRHVLRGLDELAEGRCRSEYAQRLLPVVVEACEAEACKPDLHVDMEPLETQPFSLRLLELVC